MSLLKPGPHTTIEHLAQKLLQRWVPKWYEAFSDQERGGFYERLGKGFNPVFTGRRRLLTQCRQLAMYSHARLYKDARFAPDLKDKFAFLAENYHVGQKNLGRAGGWLFSVDDNGVPLETHYDLYGHAFVIFALSHYYRATKDSEAKRLARQTLDFIDGSFRVDGLPGLVEIIDEKGKPLEALRRHESHMHLLEACLFAAETWEDPVFYVMADDMADLFVRYFYDQKNNLLSEYYTDMLRPCPEQEGGPLVVEPGHYCEWIWLLKKHATLNGDGSRYDDLCRPLLSWANEHGWDRDYGGIYDELTPAGEIIADTKRLWPFAEALKANALMLDSQVNKVAVKKRIKDMVKVFGEHYMEERGFWTEWLNRDLTPATDYMPGTTPYHVYFGIMETREAMHARGRMKSWAARPRVLAYTARRYLSAGARAVRMRVKRTLAVKDSS